MFKICVKTDVCPHEMPLKSKFDKLEHYLEAMFKNRI